MENNLILRVLTSPYNDNTRGSVLDHEDVDGNFIFLKGNLIKSGTTANNNLILQSLNGEIVTIPLNFTGTTTGGTGIAGISALTFDTHNTIILKDTTGGTFTALVNYLSGLTVTGSVMNGTGVTASGIFSHAEGQSTSAQGDYSHTEGQSTNAIGIASHAEGAVTSAQGQYSHSEGVTTQAVGVGAHAEGQNTMATGSAAHAEGFGSTASGAYSHAEGQNTIATGNYSHTEGSGTTTNLTAIYSHTEGYSTTANAPFSHTEGYSAKTNTTAAYSHAEGSGTTTNGLYSHAEGQLTQANGAGAHSEGQGTVAAGDVSHAEGIVTFANGGGSHTEGQFTTANGNYSHAEGSGTIAGGDYGHAEGSGAQANGLASHAEGAQAVASGVTSHAEGQQTTAGGIASHSEGRSSIAKGDYSHAEGVSTNANGMNSHAEGQGSQAIGDASHAEGYFTNATGFTSHSEGSGTTASGLFSHAEGETTTASGKGSHAEGYRNVASTAYSHAEGSGNTATGLSSHAEGQNTLAQGQSSHAEGNNTSAIGGWSHAEGNASIANGNYSHAEGGGSTANGQFSHAEGVSRADGANAHSEGSGFAQADFSHAEGSGTTSSGIYSHVEGKFNVASGPFSHAEGTGNTASGLASHAEGLVTRATGDYSHAEGEATLASGEGAHAEGQNNTAGGVSSHAEGASNFASGTASHAEGANTVASGTYSHAEGFQTQSIGTQSHAEGSGTTANGSSSHAEGSGTMANGFGSHAEGNFTLAEGKYSHAEGSGTTASGDASHAEGSGTTALATGSHAAGRGTIASGIFQSVIGTFNTTGNTNQGSFIIGNGTSTSNRSDLALFDSTGITFNQPLSATTYYGTSKLTDNQFVGSIYSASSWSSLSAFTNSGATVNIVGNKLQFSGGTGSYTQTLGLTRATALEYWKMTAIVSIDEITSTSYGFGLGINSINTFGQNSIVGRVAYTTSGNTLYLDTGANGSWGNTTNSSISAVTAGTQVELTVERSINVFYVTIRNVTTNSVPFTITSTYQFLTNSGVPNTGFFSIFSFGGRFTVQSVNYISKELKNADLLLIGDSKTVGYYASSFESRFATLLNSDYKVAVHAGGSDRTIEVLSAMTEILSMTPKQALICIGSNDLRTGVPKATYEANYLSISNQLRSIGTDVYYALPFYETAIDLTPQVNFINTAFTQDKIIDTFNPLKIAGSLNGDGVHPSDQGHTIIYNTIIDSFKIGKRDKQIVTNIGSGATGTIPLWNSTKTLSNSSLVEGQIVINANKQVRFNNNFSVFNAAGATNEKYWNFFANGNNFDFTLVDDGTSTNVNWLTVQRSGQSVSNIQLWGPTIVNSTAGIPLTLPAISNTASVSIGGTVAGYSLPLYANVNANNGLACQLINTNTTANGYCNIYLAVNGTTGANANIAFYNTTTSNYWVVGQQSSTSSFIVGNGAAFYQDFNGTNPLIITTGNTIGIGGVSLPTARLHLLGGIGSANTASLKLGSGSLTPAPENGAIEFDGSHFYGSVGTNRYILDNQPVVSAKTTNYNILTTDVGRYFTNEGANGTVNFNLPSALQNMMYSFVVRSANSLRISAATGNNISIAGSINTANSISAATTATSVTLLAINSTDWIATSVVGTWS